MGTSKSFSETNHSMIPNWGNLSSSLTVSCDGTILSVDKRSTILKNFVSAIGGASIAGRGKSKIGGRSSLKSAKKIGTVFSKFISSGNSIRETLTSIGVTDIENKSVNDIINHLIEYCSSDSSSIDDSAAKEATRLLMEELIGQANSIEEIESLLSQRFESVSLEYTIVSYFGYYINELLSRWFYEHLIKSKASKDCNLLFKQIKDFIKERIVDVHKKSPLQNVDWGSQQVYVFKLIWTHFCRN